MNLGVELSMLALNFYSDLHGLPLCPVLLFANYDLTVYVWSVGKV